MMFSYLLLILKSLPQTDSKWNDKYELIYNPRQMIRRWGMPIFDLIMIL